MKKQPKKIREITLDQPALAANQVTVESAGDSVSLLFYQCIRGIEAGNEIVSFLRGVASVSLSPVIAKELMGLLVKTIENIELHNGEIKSKPVIIQLEERVRKSPAGRYEEKLQ